MQALMAALLHEVPDLGYIDVWSNDSGSGLEHTKSLYVGRNGGAYMIREWKDDAVIAKTAGGHVLRFFGLLRDAARLPEVTTFGAQLSLAERPLGVLPFPSVPILLFPVSAVAVLSVCVLASFSFLTFSSAQ
jgi:hypothetical protein